MTSKAHTLIIDITPIMAFLPTMVSVATKSIAILFVILSKFKKSSIDANRAHRIDHLSAD